MAWWEAPTLSRWWCDVTAYLVDLVIYDSVLFNRTGQVRRWADRVEKKFTYNAWAEAPDGFETGRENKSRQNAMFPAGSLKESIEGEVTRVAPKHLVTTISVNVPYALYVLKGTGDIFPVTAEYLYLPPNPGHGTRTRHQWVSGQEANNFLSRAATQTARTHPSLRGFGDVVGAL